LSTVGFGDFNPKSNAERLYTGFAMLFGVAIFSSIMGNFIGIIESFKVFDAEIEQTDELAKFLGVLERFNNFIPLN
jgi:hypothetical protein